MDFKPQTFFIGVTDFFSVLLPGALFTWFIKTVFENQNYLQQFLQNPENETTRWIGFVIVAYIFGNMLFVFSSLILDKIYDPYLRNLVKSRGSVNLEVIIAAAIRDRFIDTDEWITKLKEKNKLSKEDIKSIYSKNYREIINPYKWSQYYLQLNNPEALAEVKKIEADSKFFRSLVLTFFIMFVFPSYQNEWIIWIYFLLSCLSFYVFASLRFINFIDRQRYWFLAFVVICFGVFIYYSLPISISQWIFLGLSLISFHLYSSLRYKSNIKVYEFIIAHFHKEPISVFINNPSTSPDKVFANNNAIPTKYLFRINYLQKGFSNSHRLVTIIMSKKNEMQVAENNEWWYCLDGQGSIIIEDKDTYFFQPNGIVPITKGTKFALHNKNQQPLQVVVFN
jgi:hypothetical protein